mmetsp:Transcript_68837/g.154143  ORF Transcript_68837/g.154143 Transcript_68837/m.154143 type:complete len:338 (-) Transcript_68837:227-1240(-)
MRGCPPPFRVPGPGRSRWSRPGATRATGGPALACRPRAPSAPTTAAAARRGTPTEATPGAAGGCPACLSACPVRCPPSGPAAAACREGSPRRAAAPIPAPSPRSSSPRRPGRPPAAGRPPCARSCSPRGPRLAWTAARSARTWAAAPRAATAEGRGSWRLPCRHRARPGGRGRVEAFLSLPSRAPSPRSAGRPQPRSAGSAAAPRTAPPAAARSLWAPPRPCASARRSKRRRSMPPRNRRALLRPHPRLSRGRCSTSEPARLAESSPLLSWCSSRSRSRWRCSSGSSATAPAARRTCRCLRPAWRRTSPWTRWSTRCPAAVSRSLSMPGWSCCKRCT